MLADSHCHILDSRLASRAEQIIESLNNDGLEFIVEASASPQESRLSLEFADKHKNVYCTLGVHPHAVHEYSDEFEQWVTALSDNEKQKVVAIGECGLDYYHMPHPKEIQKEVFIRQIMLAEKMELPLVLHMRNSFEDMLEILLENKNHIKNGLLFHCYSEGAGEVERIREHFDAYFSFGGAITYKKKLTPSGDTPSIKDSDESIRAVPLNRLLVETDAPYLAPTPLRGKVNEPKNVKYVAEHIAGVLGLLFEQVAAATLANTKRFFKIS